MLKKNLASAFCGGARFFSGNKEKSVAISCWVLAAGSGLAEPGAAVSLPTGRVTDRYGSTCGNRFPIGAVYQPENHIVGGNAVMHCNKKTPLIPEMFCPNTNHDALPLRKFTHRLLADILTQVHPHYRLPGMA